MGADHAADAAGEDDRVASDREAFQQVNATDHTVLCCIRDGTDDVRAINRETVLTRHQINAAFRRLDELDLVLVTRPDGRVSERIDGRRVSYPAPKEAALTARGTAYFEWAATTTHQDGRGPVNIQAVAEQTTEALDQARANADDIALLKDWMKRIQQAKLAELEDDGHT